MTGAEWEAFCEVLDKGFRGYNPEKDATRRMLLGDLPFDVAVAAVRLLVAEGQEFVPEPGRVMDAAQRLTVPAFPPFEEAWRTIVARMPAADLPHEEWVRNVANVLGEGPARFVQAQGQRLRWEEVDGEYGGVVRHRLRQDYDAACSQAAEDRRVGLALEQEQRARLGSGGPRQLGVAVRQIGAGG